MAKLEFDPDDVVDDTDTTPDDQVDLEGHGDGYADGDPDPVDAVQAGYEEDDQ